jgi:hypothetical protein
MPSKTRAHVQNMGKEVCPRNHQQGIHEATDHPRIGERLNETTFDKPTKLRSVLPLLLLLIFL